METRSREAFQRVIDQFPASEFVELARSRMAELDYWAEAESSLTCDPYDIYLESYPDGLFLEEASVLKQQVMDYEEAREDDLLETYAIFEAKYPESMFADSIAQRIVVLQPAAGSYEVMKTETNTDALQAYLEEFGSTGYGKLVQARLDSLTFPLHFAAQKGYTQVAKLLLAEGAEVVDASNQFGWTPLYTAAREGQNEVAALLLANGARVNARNNVRWTPLIAAARFGHAAVAELLLAHSADIDAKNRDAWTPLYAAALYGHQAVVESLLAGGAKVKITVNGGWTPLHAAAESGNREIVALFLDRGAEVEAKNESGWTPLHIAAQSGHSTLIALLLDSSAEIHAKTGNGWTPLHLAASNGQKTAVASLIANGADITSRTNGGWTPLHAAAEGGHRAVVDLLLAEGAKIDAKDSKEWTPLHLATEHGRREVADLLLVDGAEINAKTNHGWTPLHLAAEEGYEEVIALLLAQGADINAEKDDGWTPLDIAAYSGQKIVADTLRAHGGVGPVEVSYTIRLALTDTTDSFGSISIVPSKDGTPVYEEERPGDGLTFIIGLGIFFGGRGNTGSSRLVNVGPGSEIRFAGDVTVGNLRIVPVPGSRLAFRRRPSGNWAYVSGIGNMIYLDRNELVQLGYHRTVTSCLTLLSAKDEFFREGAARDLGRLTREEDIARVVPELAKLLRDEAILVRRGAAESIGRISPPNCVDLLTETIAVEERRGTRRYMEEALALCAGSTLIGRPNAPQLTNTEAARLYTSGKTHWVESVLAARIQAWSPGAVQLLMQQLDSEDATVRLVAAQLLGSARSIETQNALTALLASESNWKVRTAIKEALKNFEN